MFGHVVAIYRVAGTVATSNTHKAVLTMATKTTSKPTSKPTSNSLTVARKLAHSITSAAQGKPTSAAVAAKVLTAPSTKPMGAKVAATQNTGLGAAMANLFYQTKVVASKKVLAPNSNSFYGRLQAMAAKPITLQALVGKALAGNKFTSAKNHGMVARVRTRHAFTRFGYLVAVK